MSDFVEFDGYYVHGTSLGKTTRKVLYDGEEILAEVDTLEIELHPVHGATHGGGTFTFRVTGTGIALCRESCVPNKMGKMVWVPSDKWLPGKEPPVDPPSTEEPAEA